MDSAANSTTGFFRRTVLFHALLALALAAAGCAGRSRLRVPIFESQVEAKPKSIGVVLPLSGDHQAFGQEVLKGIRLAVKGSGISVVVRDSEGDASLAERAIEELADQEKVIAILGTILPEEARRGAARADALGVPLISFSKAEGLTNAGAYVFRNMLTLPAEAKAIADVALDQLKLRTFAVMQPDAPYGRELGAAFTERVRSRGGTVTQLLTYPPEQTNFIQEARKLAGRSDLQTREDYQRAVKDIDKNTTDPYRRRKAIERAKNSLRPIADFQALFLPDDWKKVGLIAPALAVQDLVTNACDAEYVASLTKTRGSDDIVSVTLLGWSGWSSPLGAEGVPELLKRGGKFVRCSVFVDGFFADSARPATRAFVAKFREAHPGQEPNLLSAVGYESALIYRQVIERSGLTRRGAFRSQLAELKDFEGPAGTLGFRPDGESRRALFLLRVGAAGLEELPERIETAALVDGR